MDEKLKLSIVDKKGSATSFFAVNKEIILSAIVYLCGLLSGSYFYRISDSKMLDKLLSVGSKGILNMFAENICIYLSVFLIVIFLGLCLIGYPLINVIPAVIGIASGMKISFLYINNDTKGVAFALVMVVPFLSIFLTVIALTIQQSNTFSRSISANLKDNENSDLGLKNYFSSMLKLGAVLIIASLVSAVLKSLLSGVVTI